VKSPKIVRTGGYLGEEFSCLNLITSGMKRRDEVFFGLSLDSKYNNNRGSDTEQNMTKT